MECTVLHVLTSLTFETDGIMEICSTISLFYLIVRIDHRRYHVISTCHVHIPCHGNGLCFAKFHIYIIDRSDSDKPISTSGKVGAVDKERDAHVFTLVPYAAYCCAYIHTLASSYLLRRLNTHTLNKEVIPRYHIRTVRQFIVCSIIVSIIVRNACSYRTVADFCRIPYYGNTPAFAAIQALDGGFAERGAAHVHIANV